MTNDVGLVVAPSARRALVALAVLLWSSGAPIRECAAADTGTTPSIRGERIMSVPSLPGVFALAQDGKSAYVITHERTIEHLDLERLARTRVPFEAGTPSALAVDPQGRWLAVGTEEQRVVVLNASNGAVLKTFNNNLVAVGVVAFSPDGRWLAAGDRDSRVYSTSSGWQSLPQLDSARWRYGATVVWDTTTWTRAHTFDGISGTTIGSLAFDANSERLVAGGEHPNSRTDAAEWQVSVWELSSGRLVSDLTLPVGAIRHEGSNSPYAIDPAGEFVWYWNTGGIFRVPLAACRDDGATLLPTPMLPPAYRIPGESRRYSHPALLHRTAEGKRFVLQWYPGSPVVISAASGKVLATLSAPNDEMAPLNALASDPRGKYVYGISVDRNLWRWRMPDVEAEGNVARVEVMAERGDRGQPTRLACYPALPGSPRSARMTLERSFVSGLLPETDHEKNPVLFVPARELKLAGGRLSLTRRLTLRETDELWDGQTGTRLCEQKPRDVNDRYPNETALLFRDPACYPGTTPAPGRRFLPIVRTGDDKAWRFSVFDALLKRDVWTKTVGPRAENSYDPLFIMVLAVAPDRSRAALLLSTGSIVLIELAGGKVNSLEPSGTAAFEGPLKFSADGRRLLHFWQEITRTAREIRARVIDTETLRTLHASGNYAHGNSKDGRFVQTDKQVHWLAAPSSRTNRIRLYDIEHGDTPYDIGRHRLFSGSLAVSAEGIWLATGGMDGSVRLWDLKAGAEAAAWQGPKSPAISMTFEGEDRLAVLYHSGEVQILTLQAAQ
jgi:WD40 repeat protein